MATLTSSHSIDCSNTLTHTQNKKEPTKNKKKKTFSKAKVVSADAADNDKRIQLVNR